MKDFIKRNSPVFTVGMITLVIFLVIIGASQKKENQAPFLREISEVELIAPHTYVRGNMKAPVTLVMFCDFEEVECEDYYTYMDALYQNNREYLKIAFRHFAPKGKLAATAAQVAGEQNRFWEYTEILLENTDKVKDREELINFAGQLGIDTQRFINDLDQGDYVTIVDDDTEFARRADIKSTPAFFLNGQKMEYKSIVEFKDQVEKKIRENIPQPTSTSPTTTTIPANPESQQNQDPSERFTQKEIEESKQTLEVVFTESGWEPQSAAGYPGQLVRWTNQTSETVKLVQLDQKFPEMKGGIEIAPGDSFEFRLYKDRLWRYLDEYTQKWAEIFIKY